MVKRKCTVVLARTEACCSSKVPRIEVSPLVTGVSGALHQSFPSEEEAQTVFDEAERKGNVRIVATNATPAAEAKPSSQLHREIPVSNTNGQPSREHGPAKPVARPVVVGSSPGSGPSAALNFGRVTVKSEDVDLITPSPSRKSSPLTGVTQVVSLSSSGALSPLALRQNELEPDDSSDPELSFFSSSHRVAASRSLQLSTNDNLVHPHTQQWDLNDSSLILPSRVAALSLLANSNVPREADPRSPLTQRRLLTRSSPSLGELPLLFSE
ncbi:hypothetical protein DFH06DRAFT_1162810 [Mycena polygramma]|nr:hypothetical protein DFH06DRAFT_1162810 [Mycena polygramma]